MFLLGFKFVDSMIIFYKYYIILLKFRFQKSDKF